jgi:predicted transcriptional regulator
MTEEVSQKVPRQEILRMTVTITAAFLSKNKVNTLQVSDIIKDVFKTMDTIFMKNHKQKEKPRKPVVPVRSSILPDFIVCLEDGRKMKMLKSHLRTIYNLSPDEYRSRWGLPPDYPMVAPNYAKRRSEFAKKIGLGKKKTVVTYQT